MNRSRLLLAVCLVPAAAFGHADPGGRTSQCESLVVSQEVAARDPGRRYSLELWGEAGARLVYLGVRHTFDPSDSEVTMIERAWRELRPTAAYFEGFGDQVGPTATASVAQGGEPGLVRFLASQDSVPARSLEPTRDDEVAALLPSFSPEQLVLFYVTRSMVEIRDRRHVSGAPLDTVLATMLARVHRTPRLSNALPDTAAFRAAYRKWYPGGDPASARADWFDPFRTSAETGGRFFNEINRASSAFRDIHMYRLLTGAWRPGARLLAVVGRDHVPAQAAALRCAISP